MAIFLKNVFPNSWKAENVPVVAGRLVRCKTKIVQSLIVCEEKKPLVY